MPWLCPWCKGRSARACPGGVVAPVARNSTASSFMVAEGESKGGMLRYIASQGVERCLCEARRAASPRGLEPWSIARLPWRRVWPPWRASAPRPSTSRASDPAVCETGCLRRAGSGSKSAGQDGGISVSTLGRGEAGRNITSAQHDGARRHRRSHLAIRVLCSRTGP